MKTLILFFAMFVGFCLACKEMLDKRPQIAARHQLLAATPAPAPAASPQAMQV